MASTVPSAATSTAAGAGARPGAYPLVVRFTTTPPALSACAWPGRAGDSAEPSGSSAPVGAEPFFAHTVDADCARAAAVDCTRVFRSFALTADGTSSPMATASTSSTAAAVTRT